MILSKLICDTCKEEFKNNGIYLEHYLEDVCRVIRITPHTQDSDNHFCGVSCTLKFIEEIIRKG